MSSITCPHCGMVGWVAEVCKGCGQPLQGAQAWPPPPPPRYAQSRPYAPDAAYTPYASYGAAPFKQRTGLAIASMVVGIVSFLTLCFLVGVPGAIVGLVLGIVALRNIKRDPEQYGGQGFAIAGVVVSSITLVFVLPIMAAITIPNLLASRKAANEAAAISSVRTLFSAEETYQATRGQGHYGSMDQLKTAGLIDDVLAEGVKNGYRFSVEATDEKFAVTATPGDEMTGTRSFYVSENGVLHAANKHGRVATEDDPVLGN